MEVKDIISSLKEWFFDIAGILLPGLLAVLLIGIKFSEYNAEIVVKIVNEPHTKTIYLLVLSYLAGYIIYGASKIKDFFLNVTSRRLKHISIPFDSVESMRNEILEHSKEYPLFKAFVSAKANDNVKSEITSFLNNNSIEELRSLAMSLSPDSDSKIYSFTFRSELCNNLGTVLFLASILCALSYTKLFDTALCSWKYIMALYISSFMLKKSRFKFLKISYKIPFSIANSKFLMNN